MSRLRAMARRRAVTVLLAALMGAWAAFPVLREGLTPPDSLVYAAKDCDVVMLKRGLDETPRLRDTLRWWTGNWIGCNPFWRPLSSYAFWLMHRTLGWEHHDRFGVITGLSHIAVSVLLLLLAMELTGRPLLALLAVGLCNVGPLPSPAAHWLHSPGIGGVQHWVYIPDIWLAMCVLPALLLAWRGRIWWAVLLAAVAAMFKETGFVAFPLVALFYWWRRRRLHPAFWALGLIAALFATVKLVYVGPGWVLGSNLSIWVRMFRFVAPEPLNCITAGFAPWVTVSVGLALTLIFRRSRWTRTLALPVAIVLAAAVYQLANRPEPALGGAVALVGVLEPSFLMGTTIGVALWLVLAWAGLRGAERSLIALLALGYLALGLPATIAPQTGARSLYTALLLSGSIKALCLWSLPAAFARPPAAPGPPSDEPA